MAIEKDCNSYERKLLSVIIPLYNGEGFINTCIQSVCSQPVSSQIEIVVVDDGSTDHSREVASHGLIGHKGSVQLISQKNSGVGAARNAGILSSGGKYLCFLDQDDVWVPGFFDETIVKLLENDYDMISFAYYHGNQNNTRVSIVERNEREVDDPWEARGENYRHHSSFFYNRQFIVSNHLFIDGFRHEDERFRLCCLARAKTIKYINRPVFIYKNNETSVTHQTSQDLDSVYTSCIDGWTKLMETTSDLRLSKESGGTVLHLLLEWFIASCVKDDFISWQKMVFDSHKGEELYRNRGWTSEKDNADWELLFSNPAQFRKKYRKQNRLKKVRNEILKISMVRRISEVVKYPIKWKK